MMLLRTSLRISHSTSSAGSIPIKKNWSSTTSSAIFSSIFFYPNISVSHPKCEKCRRVRRKKDGSRLYPGSGDPYGFAPEGRWNDGHAVENRLHKQDTSRPPMVTSYFLSFLSDFQRELSYIYTLCWLCPIEHRRAWCPGNTETVTSNIP